MEFCTELKKLPMFRLLIPFGAGIILQDLLQLSPHLILPGVLSFFSLTVVFFLRSRSVKPRCLAAYGVTLSIFIMLISMNLYSQRLNRHTFLDMEGENKMVVARVTGEPQERERSFRIVIRPYKIITDSVFYKTSGKAVAWFGKDSLAAGLAPGDHIVIPSGFRAISNWGNPYEFDYARYMQIQGFSGETFVPAGSWFMMDKKAHGDLSLMPGKLRMRLLKILGDYGITGREFAVSSALLLGYRSELDHETRQIYAGAGAMHILAVSGLHVGIVYIFLMWLLDRFRNIRPVRRMTPMIILAAIWFYAMLTGLSPSVSRAATMFSFLVTGRLSGRSLPFFNTLSSAALFQLLVNPFSLFMAGFQLSYLAVAGIGMYRPAIHSLFKPLNPVADKLWALASVSVSAQILIFPLIIHYFNQFPSWFLLTNFFAIPLATVILYSGLLLFVSSAVPVLAGIFALVHDNALWLLNMITGMISQLPFAQIGKMSPGLPVILLIYGTIFCLTFFVASKRTVYLRFSLMLVIAALTIMGVSETGKVNRNIFIIYNTRNAGVYNFISGRDNIIVSSGHDINNDETVMNTVRRPAMYLNARNIKIFRMDGFLQADSCIISTLCHAGSGLVTFAGRSIFIPGGRQFHFSEHAAASSNTDPYHRIYGVSVDDMRSPLPVVDILVISSVNASAIASICAGILPRLVVIDPSVSFFQRSGVIEYCRRNDLHFHDVAGSGALFIRF